jgi:hypothetical protein
MNVPTLCTEIKCQHLSKTSCQVDYTKEVFGIEDSVILFVLGISQGVLAVFSFGP